MLCYVICLANTGGVGGAGTQIPILLGMFKLGTKYAVPLSNFSIFLASFIRYILNSSRPHPLKNGTGLLVDYDYGIIMLPGIISWVSFGGIVHSLMPELVIDISYFTLLTIVQFIGIRKMIMIMLKENEYIYGDKKKSAPKFKIDGPSKEEALSKIENPKLRKIVEYESSNF